MKNRIIFDAVIVDAYISSAITPDEISFTDTPLNRDNCPTTTNTKPLTIEAQQKLLGDDDAAVLPSTVRRPPNRRQSILDDETQSEPCLNSDGEDGGDGSNRPESGPRNESLHHQLGGGGYIKSISPPWFNELSKCNNNNNNNPRCSSLNDNDSTSSSANVNIQNNTTTASASMDIKKSESTFSGLKLRSTSPKNWEIKCQSPPRRPKRTYSYSVLNARNHKALPVLKPSKPPTSYVHQVDKDKEKGGDLRVGYASSYKSQGGNAAISLYEWSSAYIYLVLKLNRAH